MEYLLYHNESHYNWSNLKVFCYHSIEIQLWNKLKHHCIVNKRLFMGFTVMSMIICKLQVILDTISVSLHCYIKCGIVYLYNKIVLHVKINADFTHS